MIPNNEDNDRNSPKEPQDDEDSPMEISKYEKVRIYCLSLPHPSTLRYKYI